MNRVDRLLDRRKRLMPAGKCLYCPPHGGMDNRIGRIPRTDRYKNHRRGPHGPAIADA